MNRITDIVAQKKNSNRYSIFVNGNYSFSLTDLDLSSLRLKVNQQLTDKQLDNLKQQADFYKAYARSLDYLSRRLRSTYEIKQYLLRKGYSEDIIIKVCDRLKRLKLLDDEFFAQSWVRQRNNLKPRSHLMLRHELISKGIDATIIATVLEQDNESSQAKALNSLIAKKQKNPKFADDQALISYLLSKGFRYSLIKKAISLSVREHQT